MNITPACVGEEIQTSNSAVRSCSTSVANWLTPGRFALLLGFIIAALFAPVLFGGETFYYRDYGIFSYPLAKYHRDCFWRGELPVWNSLSSCGIPFLAQWSTITLYPLSLIYLLLPLPWSLSFFCVAHLFLAGLGMYLLAFFWTKDSLAAAIAGVAFAFNGLTLHCLMWPCNVAGLAWMPWVVLMVQRSWQEGGKTVIAAALVGAIQMLSGAPEIILCTWLVIGTLLAAQLFKREPSRAMLFGKSLLMVALITGLAAAQLIPFLNLVGHSERNSGPVGPEWAMPVSGWLNLALPLFRMSRAGSGVYFQPEQLWTSSYYPGVGILFLGLLAAVLRTSKRAWVLWSVAILGLVLSLGDRGGLYRLIHAAFPMIGLMRYPVKFVLLTIFVLPLLAAMALAKLRPERLSDVENSRTRRRALIVLAVIILAISVGLLLSYDYRSENGLPSHVWQNGLVRVIFLMLVATLVLRRRSQTDHRLGFWLDTALLLCLVLDTWTHMPNQNPTVNSSVYKPGFAQHYNLSGAETAPRAMISKQTSAVLSHQSLPDPAEDYLSMRAGLFGNCNLLDEIKTVDGFYSLSLFEQRQIWSKLFFTPLTNFPTGLADFVGIGYFSPKLFEWQSRPSAQPLLTVGARSIFLDRYQIINRLGEAGFDPRRMVYLPTEAKSNVSVTNSALARITRSSIRPGHITAEVEASESTWLVVAESYYDGWHAFVDQKPVKIWRANHAFQAVEVPAGRRHVELVYKEKYLFAGGVISGSTLAFCLAGWFIRRKAKQGAF